MLSIVDLITKVTCIRNDKNYETKGKQQYFLHKWRNKGLMGILVNSIHCNLCWRVIWNYAYSPFKLCFELLFIWIEFSSYRENFQNRQVFGWDAMVGFEVNLYISHSHILPSNTLLRHILPVTLSLVTFAMVKFCLGNFLP